MNYKENRMTIVGCFLEHKGKFLILLRHSYKPNGDAWGLPAGKVEPDEDNSLAMIRELCEETGYKADHDELEHLGDFSFSNATNSCVFATYRIQTELMPTIKLENSAHAAMKWVTPKECYGISNLIPDLNNLLVKIGYGPNN